MLKLTAKVAFVLCVLAAMLHPALTQEPELKPTDDPRITFTDGTTYDAGFVKPDTAITRDFHFKNTGGADLLIKNVQSHCGCTIPKFSREPIAPGETGTIQVRVTQKGNRYDGTGTVYTNDPETPNLKVQVLGTPFNEVRLEPQRYEQDVLLTAEKESLRSPTELILLRIYRDSDEPDLELTNHQIIGPANLTLDTSAEILAATMENGQPVWDYPLLVKMDSSQHDRIDNLTGQIMLNGKRTEAGTTFRNYVRYTYKIRKNVDLDMTQIYFGSIPERDPVETIQRVVRVTSLDGEPFKIVSTSSSDPTIETRVEDGETPGKDYLVWVGVPTDHAPGRLDADLRIQTNHDTDAIVEVPIRGIVRR